MTLHTYDKVEQRSDEWYALRCGIVTASAVGKLLTPTLRVADNETARGVTTSLVAERITGHVEDMAITSDMWRGIEHEPFARDKYSSHYAPVTECGFMVREINGWRLGYSPDGLVGDDGLIEIKCPRAKGHLQTILSMAVPDQHMAQLQCGLFVTGREWIDYVSFCGGMPMWRKRVLPDPLWAEAITAALEKFETTATEMVAAYEQATTDLPATQRVPSLEMN
jgi:hypothetical protein